MSTARVVVASNRAWAGVYADSSGPILVTGLRQLGFEVGEPVVVPGSLGYFELAVNRGSAADRYGLKRGEPVRVQPLTDS